MATLWKCVAEPSGNPPGPLHAARRTHYACRRRLIPLASDNIDASAACAVPFRPYCGRVVTRTRNVSEYMLVLALCLVDCIEEIHFVIYCGVCYSSFICISSMALVFGRPFVKRFALCYWTVVCLSCLSVLSVTLVYCGQTVRRIKMKLGIWRQASAKAILC